MPVVPSKANGKPHGRRERLAINLFDLDEIAIALIGLGKLAMDSPIRVDPNDIKDTAIEIKRPLLEAASAIDVIQSERRRFSENPARIYVNRSGIWVRLSSSVLLTVPRNGKAVLNHEVFGAEVIHAPQAVPGPKKVF